MSAGSLAAFKAQLRQRRKKLGIRQVDLAEAIDRNQCQISKLEADGHVGSLRTYMAVAQALGCVVELRLVPVQPA